MVDFLSSMFNPQNFAGVTGLLDRLKPGLSFPTAQQPAAFGLGGPAAMPPPVDQPAPVDNAQLPANATPTVGTAPMGLVPPAPAAPSAEGGPMDFLGGVRDKINDNSNMLLGLAAGIAGGKNWGDGLSKGMTLAMTGGQLDTKRGNSNRTQQFLLSKGMDPEMARTVASNPTLLRSMLPQLMGTTDKTNDVKNFEYAAQHPEFGKFLTAGKSGGGTEYGLNPIYGTDENGNQVLGTLGKDGTFKKIDTGGVTPQSGVDKIDLGTQWMLRDKKNGQVIGYAPKDLKGEESAKAEGKVQGAAKAALPSDLQNAEQTITQIDQLLENKGLSEITGPLDQLRPNWTMSDAGRDSLARFNQLKGKAFLQAYSTLRGGGQITEVEGAKAENAMARMDRAQGEADFKQALTDFRDAVKTGMDKLREKAGVSAPQGRTSTGVSWSIE